MVGSKMQTLCPRIDMLKGRGCILRIRGAPVCQKVPKLCFQVNFLCQKSTDFFQKKIISEYQFRRPFFVKKPFFLTSIFEALYFLKSYPIFDELVLSKYNGFL